MEKCEVCGKLMCKKSLSKHMRTMHLGEKSRVTCGECGARMLKGNLRRHLRTVHSIEAQE